MKTNNKNTRLFYNDDKHIAMYKAMPPEQFKELMIAMLEYKYGDDSIVDNIQDPMVRALFLSEKVAVDKNEEKWEKRKKINQENGSKGGRPPKVVEEESIELDVDNFDFTPMEEEMRNAIPINQEIQEETNMDKQEWFESFRDSIDPNRKFKDTWYKYYEDKIKAAADVEKYLRQYKIFIKLA